MAAVTDSTFYTNQLGDQTTNPGGSTVKTYPKAGSSTVLPPIVRDLAGTESAADTFFLARLCTVTHDDAGTTLTLDIGDSVDPDRYGDGIDLAAAAGTERFTDAAIPDSMLNPYDIVEATQDVIVTIKTSGTPNAADVIFNLVIEEGSANRGPTT